MVPDVLTEAISSGMQPVPGGSVRVEVWLDYICPWCYIALSRLEAARRRFGRALDVRIHPFTVDPTLGSPGVPAIQRCELQLGRAARRVNAIIEQAAAREGIRLDFRRVVLASTFDAHRLVRYADGDERTTGIAMRLFEACFAEGADVSERDVLISIAAETGYSRDAVAAYMASDRGSAEVERDMKEGLARGITVVPTFVFNDRFATRGPVQADNLLEALHAVSR